MTKVNCSKILPEFAQRKKGMTPKIDEIMTAMQREIIVFFGGNIGGFANYSRICNSQRRFD